ncbi:MAG TPA: hypothetical protein P5323_03625 [Candidatus Moranbacteria bacterium]|nr:hypothetical protein [Candidatus Moranbacteria bacterium]HRY28202.1 hypothetical protein [Candidatus Moranbacteria bacterium]HSA08545.1 hypothetical protein [Candidatus Moranbacteria bacterium]
MYYKDIYYSFFVRIFFVIISVIIVSLLFGYANNASAENLQGYTNYEQHSDISECEKIRKDWEKCLAPPGCGEYYKTGYDPYRESTLCFMQVALKNRDINICFQKFNNSEYSNKADCVSQIAIAEKNSSLCERINEIDIPAGAVTNRLIPDSEREIIKNNCLRQVSIYTGNINTCENIQTTQIGLKEHCYINGLEKAIASKDDLIPKNPELCEKVPGSSMKELYHTKNDAYRTECYNFALSELSGEKLEEYLVKNIPICKRFPLSEDRSACYNVAFDKLTGEKFEEYLVKNIPICSKFPSAEYSANCYQKVLDSLMKSKFSDYFVENPKICEDFIEPDNKEECYQEALSVMYSYQGGTFLGKNANACINFPRQNQEECYEFAMSSLNESKSGNTYCEKFPGLSENPNTFRGIMSRMTGNFGIKSELVSKEECYFKLGIDFSGKSENNKAYIYKNIAALILILIFIFSSILLITKRKRENVPIAIVLYPMFVLASCLLTFHYLLWVDIKFFYETALYYSIYLIAISVFIYCDIKVDIKIKQKQMENKVAFNFSESEKINVESNLSRITKIILLIFLYLPIIEILIHLFIGPVRVTEKLKMLESYSIYLLITMFIVIFLLEINLKNLQKKAKLIFLSLLPLFIARLFILLINLGFFSKEGRTFGAGGGVDLIPGSLGIFIAVATVAYLFHYSLKLLRERDNFIWALLVIPYFFSQGLMIGNMGIYGGMFYMVTYFPLWIYFILIVTFSAIRSKNTFFQIIAFIGLLISFFIPIFSNSLMKLFR